MILHATSPVRLQGAASARTGGCKAVRPAVPGRDGSLVRAKASQKGGSDGAQRQPWDFGRFLKTVTFFNQPPSPAEAIKSLLGVLGGAGSRDMQGSSSSSSGTNSLVTLVDKTQAGSGARNGAREGVVMVTGATGGVGKRVVQQLLARGRRVRALVRDPEKAKTMLGGLPAAAGARLELAPADIVQAATLAPGLFDEVRAVVSCTAVKVVPKEGDTADRAKYMQGIKFYDPEIVGDTPETVEYLGVRNLVNAVQEQLGMEEGKVVLAPDVAGLAAWGALDDVVMGGVSESSMVPSRGGGEHGGDAVVFRGIVSTSNSGGFASVRRKNFEPALDLGAYEGLALRVQGDGKRYKMILRTDPGWDSIGYCLSFDTKPGQWQTVYLPFCDFIPVFRAKSVPYAPPLDASNIVGVQLMLSKFEYDGQLNPAFSAGPFALPIAHIRSYLAQPVCPRFVHVSSAGVTRPNRPGINVEQEPPAVKLNDALGGLLTYKLAGEDVVRASGVPFAVVRPCALTEEPAGAPLELDQGDVIKGKISREDVAELAVELLSAPAALDTTFEIKSTVPFSTPWQVDASDPPRPRDWRTLLEGANLRRGVTGKTIAGVYTGREPEAAQLRQPARV